MDEIDTSAKPAEWDGRPQNPDQSGWHWIKRRSPHQVPVPYCWNPHAQVWTNCPSDWIATPAEMIAPDRWSPGADYLGPCLLPHEANALAAERDALRDQRDGCGRGFGAIIERPDVAAILRGEAVAVPVEASEEMLLRAETRGCFSESRRGPRGIYAAIWSAMIAARPYAVKREQ